MALAGAGAGINELTALAVTSELAPTRQRGKYVAVLVFTIVPFCPSVLWAQLIAAHTGWRNVGAFCGAWAAVGLVLTLAFYFPPPRPTYDGHTSTTLKRIDYIGGLLSIGGIIIFNAGIQWGGYQVYTSTLLFRMMPAHISTVSVDQRTHARSSLHWRAGYRWLRSLGAQRNEIPNVSWPYRASSSGLLYHTCHHFHQRRKFLLRPSLLANSSLQRLWS